MPYAPPLQALQYSGGVEELSALVHGVPPQNEAKLLRRKLPGAVLALKPASTPACDLPTERTLWQLPRAVWVCLPRWAYGRGNDQLKRLVARQADLLKLLVRNI